MATIAVARPSLRDRLRRRVPAQVRSPLRRAAWPLRRATSAGRALPDLVIIGAQRSGTTSLYQYLAANPAVGRSYLKEVHYFDLHYDRGVGWYRAHFPTTRDLRAMGNGSGGGIALEATPNYLHHPLGPRRVRALLPQVKLVVLLRDPVSRAISHYQLSVSKGHESLPLEEALDREPERLAGERERLLSDPSYSGLSYAYFSYATRGRYAEQLEHWLAVFPREQLLVLDTAALFRDPDASVREVCEFAGIAHRPLKSYGVRQARDYDQYAAVRPRLREYFAPHNQRLQELLDQEFEWA
jgi:hypothetical protein